MTNGLPFHQDRPVVVEDLKEGMTIWSTVLNGPITVRSIVQDQSVVFVLPSGQRLINTLSAIRTMPNLYFHMAQTSNDSATCELRALAYRLIDQGHQMLQAIERITSQETE